MRMHRCRTSTGRPWVCYQAVFWALGTYASCPPVHGELTLYAQGKIRLTAAGRYIVSGPFSWCNFDSAPAIVAPFDHVETRRHCSCFAVHGLLDGARSKGLATESWLDGVLAQARIAESLLHLEQSRVTIEQYIALFSAVKNSLTTNA